MPTEASVENAAIPAELLFAAAAATAASAIVSTKEI
jgi:hypothetical protein